MDNIPNWFLTQFNSILKFIFDHHKIHWSDKKLHNVAQKFLRPVLRLLMQILKSYLAPYMECAYNSTNFKVMHITSVCQYLKLLVFILHCPDFKLNKSK